MHESAGVSGANRRLYDQAIDARLFHAWVVVLVTVARWRAVQLVVDALAERDDTSIDYAQNARRIH